MIALVLLLQANATVGDTIWIERLVRVPERRVVQAAEWAPTGDVELLGEPKVTFQEGAARVAYPAVAWRAGVHEMEVPGPLLTAPDGSVDSLPAERVALTVTSVLPDVSADSTLRPQPPAQIVSRRAESAVPLLVLWALSVALLAPLHFWWGRRGMASVALSGTPPQAPAERWAEAGEYRAALAAAATRLRSGGTDRAAGASAPTTSTSATEVLRLLDAIDTARFGMVPAADAQAMLERARALETRISSAGAVTG